MSNLNNILLKRAVSKKGSVLFCVLCVMTFVVMLAGIALALTSSAHQSVIYEEKNQQAYYTAKSAVDSVVAYLDSNGTTGSGTTLSYKVGQLDSENYKKVVNFSDASLTSDEVNKIKDPWPKDTTQRRSNWDTAAGAGTYIAGEWSTDYAGIGKYRVDVYPTLAKGLYKIIAESDYKGHTSVVAAIVVPGKSQALFEDAIVGLGGAGIAGSSRVCGGIALNVPGGFDGKNSPYGGQDVYLGGNITNTGDINLQENQHAVPITTFNNIQTTQQNIIIAARGNLSVGQTIIEGTSKAVWPYYSYLVAEKDLTIKNWESKDNYYFANIIDDDTINHKGILVGGNFLQGAGSTGATFSSSVYVKGNINFSNGGTFIFEQPVYVLGNINLQNGTFVFKNGLYVKGSANISVDSFTGDLYSDSINFHSNAGARTLNSYSTTIQGDIDACENVYQEKLSICDKVNNYSDWVFTSQQREKMGLDGVDSNSYNHYSIDVNGSMPKLNVSGKTISTQSGNNLTINDSGVIEKFTLKNSTNGATTINFDTRNGADPSGNQKYKNLYIRLNPVSNSISKKVTGDDVNKCTINIIGKGNVFLYLDTGVRWESNEVSITGNDNTAIDGGLQPHLFIISNDSSSSYNDYIINVGSANGTNGDRFAFYLYVPNGAISQGGSSGFRGSAIAKYVNECGGSNCSFSFISPATGNTDEANDGMPNSSSASSGYSVKTWYKY